MGIEKYVTKKAFDDFEKKILKLIVETKAGNMALSINVDAWSQDVNTLNVNFAECNDRLHTLEAQVKKLFAETKQRPMTEEWYKYQAMRDCVKEISVAIKKYNGR